MPFPESCLRGLTKPEDLISGKQEPASPLFYFNLKGARQDGWIELSINWEDGIPETLKHTLNQKKPDSDQFQFRFGCVRLPTTELDRLKNHRRFSDTFSYERQPLEDNPFHGNILLREGTSKMEMRMIAAQLALESSSVITEAG